MPIAQLQEIVLSLLRRSAGGREWTFAAPGGRTADDFGLTDSERADLFPSGAQARFLKRICGAKIHLDRAGLLARVHAVL